MMAVLFENARITNLLGSEVSVEGLDKRNQVASPGEGGSEKLEEPPAAASAKDSKLSKEQEEKLEEWMEEVKAFIRTIDIDAL